MYAIYITVVIIEEEVMDLGRSWGPWGKLGQGRSGNDATPFMGVSLVSIPMRQEGNPVYHYSIARVGSNF